MDSRHHENDGISGLISLLRERRGVLMVGAGSSAIVGYPGWRDLITSLKKKFAPDLPEPASGDYLVYSDLIKESIVSSGRIGEYHKFLDRTFEPHRNRENYTDFHSALIRLGFRGMVTTNYDKVLEFAAGAVNNGRDYRPCESIDLCNRHRQYRVFEFLRSLSPENLYTSVLHLHGCHDNAREIILTRGDYLDKYGMRDPERGPSPRPGRILDSFHRKVIWSLLVMHPLVFVGFGMNDPFFMDMLRIVQHDFSLDADPVHFAIMRYTTDDERRAIESELRGNGVQPIFYYAPRDQNGVADHRGLQNMIFDLQNILARDQRRPAEPEAGQGDLLEIPAEAADLPSLDEVNRRTLGLW
ncbi:MAG: SIR2 family protein [Candidatus Methanoculleus thermohydrogenotrophicum]